MGLRIAALAATVAGVACGRIHFGPSSADLGDATATDSPASGDGAACVARAFTIGTSAHDADDPAVAWDGSKLAVAWVDDPTNTPTGLFRTATRDGTLDPTNNLATLGPSEPVSVAADAADWRVVWASDLTANNREVYRSNGTSAAIQLTSTPRTEVHPRVIALPGSYSAYTWLYDNTTGFEVRLTVLDPSGSPIVNQSVIGTIPTVSSLAHDLVWDGSEIVIAFAADTHVQIARRSMTGAPVGQLVDLDLQTSVQSLSIASAGTRLLLATQPGPKIMYMEKDGSLPVTVSAPMTSGLFTLGVMAVGGATSDAVVWNDIGNNASYFVPIYRDGTAGSLVTFPGARGISAVWLDSAFGVAFSTNGTPRPIEWNELCP